MKLLSWFGRKGDQEPERIENADVYPEVEKTSQRKPHRLGLSIRSAFTGAQFSDLTASWSKSAQNQPINAFIKAELITIRARSRELFRNDPYLKRFISLMKSNVIGVNGIELIPDGKNKAIKKALKQAWEEWAEFGGPDITGQHDLVSFLNLYLTSWLIDGEVFVRKHVGDVGNDLGFALEIIDAALIDSTYSIDNFNGSGNRITCGIEYSQSGRPVAYHLSGKNGNDYYLVGSRALTRIPADQIMHRFTIEYPSQSRGIPAVAAAMFRLKMLSGYEEAEVTAARVAAAKMGFFTRSAEGHGYEGEESEDGSRIMDAAPGTFEELDPGVNLETFDPQHPGANYGAFIKAVLRAIASGLGVSYNSLANDLEGVNFSSIRSSVLEDRELYKAAQNWIIRSFLKPMFKDWREYAVLSGTVRASDHRAIICYWQPRRWAWVDPVKDQKAAELAIALKTKSRSEVIRESGRDPVEVWREIQEEIELLESMGLDISTPEEKKAEQEPAPDNKDDDPDDDKQKDKGGKDANSNTE